jgi:ketosteroid isomerase-like protein
MSQENVKVVQRCLAAFNAHDVTAWSSLLDSEFELVDHMAAVGEDVVSGIEATRRQLEGWFDAFPDFRAETEEFIEAGDRVVCVTRWRGTGAASGLLYDQAAAEVFTVREGKIVHAELGFDNRASALKAVGLEE